MSKGEGKKIVIKFTDAILGDISNLVHMPIGSPGAPIQVGGYQSHSSMYSSSGTSYPGTRAFDNNVSTFWYTRNAAPQWVRNRLVRPVYAAGFRWYIGSSYRPNAFFVEGSNDGISWDVLYVGSSPNATGWHEFYFNSCGYYTEYRWIVDSYYFNYLYIYEIELIEKTDFALDVLGIQRPLAHSQQKLTRYPLVSVEQHPSEARAILLTFHDELTFRNVDGELTIKYDSSKGNLIGRGGPVESFEVSFIPEGLVRFPKPEAVEKILISNSIVVELLPMTYHERSSEHGTITVSLIETSVELVPINIENP